MQLVIPVLQLLANYLILNLFEHLFNPEFVEQD